MAFLVHTHQAMLMVVVQEAEVTGKLVLTLMRRVAPVFMVIQIRFNQEHTLCITS